MKNGLFLFLILAGGYAILPSCKKSSAQPSKTDSTTTKTTVDSSTFASVSLLAARWSIVRDTVTNSGGFSIDFYTPPSRNYVGGPNDYVTFTTGGVVSGSEDSVAIKGTYALSANKGIVLSMLPALSNATITTLTSDSLTITGTASNGSGSLAETIYLKR